MSPFHCLTPSRTISFAWLIDIDGVSSVGEPFYLKSKTAGSPVLMKDAQCYKATRSLTAYANAPDVGKGTVCPAFPARASALSESQGAQD
jgi:hypothetical protein